MDYRPDVPQTPPQQKQTAHPLKEVEEKREVQQEKESISIFEEGLAKGSHFICRALSWILLVIASIIAYFTVAETTTFLVQLRQLTRLEQVLLVIPLIFFGIILVYIVGKMITLFWRYKTSPGISIKASSTFSNRLDFQKKCRKDSDLLFKWMTDIMEDETFHKFFASLPDKDKNPYKELQTEMQYCREIKSKISPDERINTFRDRFLSILDKKAQERISYYAKRVGVATAAAPYALLDKIIVCTASFSLLKELMQIYHLKPSGAKILFLMAKATINIYIAGAIGVWGDKVQDVAEDASQDLSSYLQENLHFPEFAANSTKAGLPLVGKVVGKAAEGFVNGIMIARLGKYAMKSLQPIVSEK